MIPRKEHPNPQFERSNWINLNGEWDFEIDQGDSGYWRGFLEEDHPFADKIIVPFCPESRLSGLAHVDFIHACWYRKAVQMPAGFNQNQRVLLHIGACDYETRVYVNKRECGHHLGGYTSFAFDITGALREGDNTVLVYVRDDTRDPMQANGKQSRVYISRGCDYTRTTGIWQTVWLEFVPENHIKSVKFYPNIDDGSVNMQVDLAGYGDLEVKAFYRGKEMGSAACKAGGTADLHIDLAETHLWEIGAGRLYDVELRFGEDVVKSYFGLRTVRMEGMKFMLNNKSVFQRLVLDQGYYRDGIYTAPTEEDLIKDIQISLDMGFNGARLHQKTFEPRFLYHCDRMGYIVWGEYGNWGLDISDAKILTYMLPEWVEEMERDFNHPALIGWCPFNETWNYEGRSQNGMILSTVYHVTKAIDPTRPCIDTSGNFHVITDIYDVHDYEQDVETFKKHYDQLMADGTLYDHLGSAQVYRGEPTFLSEYGGMRWAPDSDEGWGYGNAPKTEEEFIARYKGLTDALLDNDKMMGFCYTQLYDIEQEVNGLYTYDRDPKFDPAVIKAINSRKAKIED